VFRGPIAGLLAWLIPGLGHFFLGQKRRAVVFFVTIAATFWTGVAIGGVRATVDPAKRSLWFAAQVCSGVNAFAAYALHRSVASSAEPSGPYLSSEVGVHYTGVAGLLNILIVLDAIGCADRRFGGRHAAEGAP
jgi:hypothetical protein